MYVCMKTFKTTSSDLYAKLPFTLSVTLLAADVFFNRPVSDENRCPVMRSNEVWTSFVFSFAAATAIVEVVE